MIGEDIDHGSSKSKFKLYILHQMPFKLEFGCLESFIFFQPWNLRRFRQQGTFYQSITELLFETRNQSYAKLCPRSQSRTSRMGKLEGKSALITGGGSGIGAAIAIRFAQEGAQVYIVGRREEKLAEVAAEIGPCATTIRADISNLTELDAVFAKIAKDGRKLDIVVANAGQTGTVPLAEVDEKHYDGLFNLNVRATFFTVQKAIPFLGSQASVILVSSSLNIRSFPGMSVYCASKAAVRALGKNFAEELIPYNARVNTLSPGPVDTPIVEAQTKTPEEAAIFRKWAGQQSPMGRMGRPEEVATAALFLASDDSSFSTGMELRVDGGHAELESPVVAGRPYKD